MLNEQREMLEAAAAAAGYIPESMRGNQHFLDGLLSTWKPLERNSDAIMLLIDARLTVHVQCDRTVGYGQSSCATEFFANHSSEEYGATRWAIVKSAAKAVVE